MQQRTAVALAAGFTLALTAVAVALFAPVTAPPSSTRPSLDPLAAPLGTASAMASSTHSDWSGPTCPWVPSKAPAVPESSGSLSSFLRSLMPTTTTTTTTTTRQSTATSARTALPGDLSDAHILDALTKRAAVGDGHYVAVAEGRAPGARPLWATHSFQLFPAKTGRHSPSSSSSSSSSSPASAQSPSTVLPGDAAGSLSSLLPRISAWWSALWSSSGSSSGSGSTPVSGPYDGSHVLRNAVTGAPYLLRSPRDLPDTHIFLHNGGYIDTDTVATHPRAESARSHTRGLPKADRHDALTGDEWYNTPLEHEGTSVLFWLKTTEQLSEEHKAELTALLGGDATLSHYLPVNTYQLYTTPESLDAIKDHALVVWVGAVPPGAKLASHFAATAGPTPHMRSAVGGDTHVDDIYMPHRITVRLAPPHKNAEELVASWAAPLADALGLDESAVLLEVASPHTITLKLELEESQSHSTGLNSFTPEHSASLRSIARSAADWLTRRRPVLWVEHRPVIRVHNKYGITLMQSDTDDETPIWDSGLTGAGQVVGVGDSGIDMGHCMFRDDSESVPYGTINPSHRKVIGYYNVDGADRDDDCGAEDNGIGHGTHVAGTVAGNANGGPNNIDDYNGAAPDAKLVLIDMGSAEAAGAIFTPADLADGYYDIAAAGGAGIMSSSWGGVGAGCDLLCWDTNHYTASTNDNMLSVIAAGNSGDPVGHYSSGTPGTAKNALTVGASMNSFAAFSESCCWNEGLPDPLGEECCLGYDENKANGNNMAAFSSRGPTIDGRFKPELAAPGFFVGSARSDCQIDNNQCNGPLNGAIMYIAGTSMATPMTSGHVALQREWWSDEGVSNPTAARLKASALASTFPHSGTVVVDATAGAEPVTLADYSLGSYIEGAGRYIPGLAMPVDGGPEMWGVDDTSTGSNYRAAYTVTTTSTGPFHAALVWSDPAASILSGYQLVNDLDLFVVRASTTYQGNGHMRPAPKPTDSTNNFELVYIENAVPATYVVYVYGRSGSASQDYSLVLSGEWTVAPVASGLTDCPDDCGPGSCTGGTCDCLGTGFGGADCSVRISDVGAASTLRYGMARPFGWNYWSFDASSGSGDAVVVMRRASYGRGDPDLYCQTSSGVPDLATTPADRYDVNAGDVHYVRIPAPGASTITCGVFGSSAWAAPYTLSVERCADADACCDDFPDLCDIGDLRGLTAAPYAEVPSADGSAGRSVGSALPAGLGVVSLALLVLGLASRRRNSSSSDASSTSV